MSPDPTAFITQAPHDAGADFAPHQLASLAAPRKFEEPVRDVFADLERVARHVPEADAFAVALTTHVAGGIPLHLRDVVKYARNVRSATKKQGGASAPNPCSAHLAGGELEENQWSMSKSLAAARRTCEKQPPGNQ